ncbi:MAG: hypothetical protein ACI9HK_002150 [Pirellulaceae bacterium]|jgi:hypothetical protein
MLHRETRWFLAGAARILNVRAAFLRGRGLPREDFDGGALDPEIDPTENRWFDSGCQGVSYA